MASRDDDQGTIILASRVVRDLPGLGVTVLIATAAIGVAGVTPAAVSGVLVALLTGLLITNLRPVPSVLRPGIDTAAKRVLRIGVALLGARLTLQDVAAIGGPSLVVVLVTMSTAFVTVAVAGRLAGIGRELGILLGTGTAVCGNSAIVAASPIIDAEDREVSYAVATITIFGTVALVLFPLIGRATGMPDEVFGVWAGLAINDTSQVVAAGAAYSEQALEHATVVKLVRNALMGPVLVALAVWTGRRRRAARDAGVPPAGAAAHEDTAASDGTAEPDVPDAGRRGTVGIGLMQTTRSAIPTFVIAFVVLAGARSVGLVGDRVAELLGIVSTVAITIAIAGVGLKTRIAELSSVGLRPVLVGFVAATALAIVALPLAYLVAG